MYNRGRSRLSIFHRRADCLNVLRRMKESLAALELTLIVYCLMPNHYHFLIRQDAEDPARKFPQRIFNGYSKHYNHKYDHSGTIFEGPYKINLVDSDSYLRHLCRYIHANPVKDGMCPYVEEWEYSNYPEWVGIRAGTLVDHQFIADYFENGRKYEAFVKEYLNEQE
ncbi:MAG: transposase [Chloroflexota bacterium]